MQPHFDLIYTYYLNKHKCAGESSLCLGYYFRVTKRLIERERERERESPSVISFIPIGQIKRRNQTKRPITSEAWTLLSRDKLGPGRIGQLQPTPIVQKSTTPTEDNTLITLTFFNRIVDYLILF